MKSVCQEIARKEVQFSGQSLLVLLQFATICLFGFPLSCDFLISISQHQMTQPPICVERPEWGDKSTHFYQQINKQPQMRVEWNIKLSAIVKLRKPRCSCKICQRESIILQCWISDKKSSSLSFSKDIDTYCQCYRIGKTFKLQISVDAGDCGCILWTASWSPSTCSGTYSYAIVPRHLGSWFRIKNPPDLRSLKSLTPRTKYP